MEIKDLNKSQLILLAILISFVTSLATGITTVTLLEQAPPAVTTPINRIVRQTVERIEQVQGKTVTETVVIKEEDLVVDAIEKNRSAIFSLSYEKSLDAAVAGRGFALNTDGAVVVDATGLQGPPYYLSNASGKFKADLIGRDPLGFAIFKLGVPTEEGQTPSFTVPTPGDLSKMRAGQKVLILGPSITSVILDESGKINLNPAPGNSGAMVLNLEGETLGIALFSDANPFVPISRILEFLSTEAGQ